MKSILIPNRIEFYATCVACLGTLLCGVDMSFSADLISQIRDMPITIYEQSLIGSINMYAKAVSSLVVAFLLNIIGRKNSLLLILLCHIISWTLMSFFSFSMMTVYISRGFSGFASGMRTPTTMYVIESGNKNRRGILISILGLSISLGIALTYVIQYFSSWYIVSLVSLIISVLGFIQTCFLKETKYWYLYKNNIEKAKESIVWFDNSLSDNAIQEEINEILSTDSQLTNRKINILAIIKNRTYVKSFMFGFLLLTFVFGCGRVQITSHPYNYYIQFQLPVTYSNITLVQGILELLMSGLCTLCIDNISRKTLLHLCCWIMNACLMVTLFHDILSNNFGCIGQWLLFTSLMIFYSVACGFLLCLTTIMVAEIVSITTEARGVFQSLLYFWSHLISGVYNEVFPYALVAVPVNYVVLFFFINLFLLSFSGFFVSETRGKALHHCRAEKTSKAPEHMNKSDPALDS